MSERDLRVLLAGMRPVLSDRTYVYAASDDEQLLRQAFAVVREVEGTTVVVEESMGPAGPETSAPMALITLTVHSSLEAVGLTAAVSRALTSAGIPCNVIAGLRHDHLLVPSDRAADALAALRELTP